MEEKTPEAMEFEAEWMKLGLLFRFLDDLDLEKMQATVEAAESVGPILYPSEYRDSGDNLVNQAKVLSAAISLRDAFREVLVEEER